jgi:hypothetical protein
MVPQVRHRGEKKTWLTKTVVYEYRKAMGRIPNASLLTSAKYMWHCQEIDAFKE